MTQPTTAQRLQEAAFALFAEQGYEATTVDQIAQRAGVGRATFFRVFPSKEAVIFPDHERVLAQIEERLAGATPSQPFPAVIEAARVVLLAYIREGDLARDRYRLTQTVPALRDREIAGQRRYQQLFAQYTRQWFAGEDVASLLHAELLANAVVVAHNLVLRRWLRQATSAPEVEFDIVMAEVERLFTTPDAEDRSRPTGGGSGGVIVLQPGADLEEALTAVRRVLA